MNNLTVLSGSPSVGTPIVTAHGIGFTGCGMAAAAAKPRTASTFDRKDDAQAPPRGRPV